MIIEYKLASNENVIDPGLFYLDGSGSPRGLRGRSEGSAGRCRSCLDSVPLNSSCRWVSRYDQYAVNRIDDRIELWIYTFYEGGILGVDLLSSGRSPNRRSRVLPQRFRRPIGRSRPDLLTTFSTISPR